MTVLADTLERTRETTTEIRRQRDSLKRALPIVYIYKNNPDGTTAGLIYQGRFNPRELTKYQFPQVENVSSQGYAEVRASHYLAKFIATVPNNPDECKNIIVRVDMYNGGWRWSGLLHHWEVETREGVDYFTMHFNEDMQFLDPYLLGPPNPILPIDIFQFPRDWPEFGPSNWVCSSFIWLQLLRKQALDFTGLLISGVMTLVTDPFDLLSWAEEQITSLNPANWQVHMKAPSFVTDTSLWTFIGSRMNTVGSVIADALDDGQLTIKYRRIFTDEGETVTGLLDNNVANGALVFEIVDNSGLTLPGGTFFGGSVIGGAVRSIIQYSSGFVEDTLNTVTDSEALYPDEYWQASWLGTLAQAPGVCVRDSHMNDLQSRVTHSPSTAVSVIVGGDNPTADAIAKLIIEAVGNLVGYFLLGGFASLGDMAADVIMPFLQGTIAAWDEWENTGRKKDLGWVHLFEIYQQGAENNSWSLAALAALRGGFQATESQTSHTMIIGKNTWPIPGLHFNLGDRLMSTAGALRRMGLNVLFINQVKEMTLTGGPDGQFDFLVKVGENKAAMSQGERAARTFKKILEKLQDIGVRLVS